MTLHDDNITFNPKDIDASSLKYLILWSMNNSKDLLVDSDFFRAPQFFSSTYFFGLLCIVLYVDEDLCFRLAHSLAN